MSLARVLQLRLPIYCVIRTFSVIFHTILTTTTERDAFFIFLLELQTLLTLVVVRTEARIYAGMLVGVDRCSCL